jgi:hypothetical protein
VQDILIRYFLHAVPVAVAEDEDEDESYLVHTVRTTPWKVCLGHPLLPVRCMTGRCGTEISPWGTRPQQHPWIVREEKIYDDRRGQDRRGKVRGGENLSEEKRRLWQLRLC